MHVRTRIVRALWQNAPQCLRHLVIGSDTDYRTVVWFLMVMEREGEIEALDGIALTTGPEGPVAQASRCVLCDAERSSSSLASNARAELAAELTAMRLTPSLFYGQRGITPETVLKRCEYMTRRGDIDRRRIVFLGDNDYQSVALALTAKPERVAALDIDVRVLSKIEQAASKYGLAIETWHHDLYEPLRPELRNSFDVFIFDPYPTPDASFEAMVIAKGINLLETGGNGIGYTFALPTHKFRQNSLPLQRVLANSGLVVTDVVPRFAEFLPIAGELVPDESEWIDRLGGTKDLVSHTKSLVRFEATEITRAPELLYDPEETSAGRRQELVRGMGTHYLLHAVGFEAQKGLVLETASDRAEWERAFEGVEPAREVDTMPVDRLLQEIVGQPLPEREVARLLQEAERETVLRFAAANGYSVDEAEAEALTTMAKAGYGGLVEAGLAADAELRALYLAARVFASYFRGGT